MHALETGPVLVAYDGSSSARRALSHAADLVGDGGRLTVINVIPEQSVSSRLETVSDARRARQERLLREAVALLARRGIQARAVEAVGDPVTEILATAGESGAATIVVGRGSPRSHVLHGSVSSSLVRRATSDVLVVTELSERRPPNGVPHATRRSSDRPIVRRPTGRPSSDTTVGGEGDGPQAAQCLRS